MTDKHHSEMKIKNENISTMLQNLTAKNTKTEKHEEQLTDISSKLSNYEVLTINSEYPTSSDQFKRKFQAKAFTSDQSFKN